MVKGNTQSEAMIFNVKIMNTPFVDFKSPIFVLDNNTYLDSGGQDLPRLTVHHRVELNSHQSQSREKNSVLLFALFFDSKMPPGSHKTAAISAFMLMSLAAGTSL